jgi:hypothetical protein
MRLIPRSDQRRCIYCLEHKAIAQFNREHVLQESMAAFTPVPKLECACTTCNQTFGNTIDRHLGRDSAESFQRVWVGGRPASDHKHLGLNTKLRFEPEDVGIDGTSLLPVPLQDADHFGLLTLDHAVFRQRDRKQSLTYLANDLPTPRELSQKGFAIDEIEVQICGYGAERTISELQQRGFRLITTLDSGAVPGRVLAGCTVFTGTPEICRAIVKSCFNYFAFVHGSTAALDAAFNHIRGFVLRGAGSRRDILKLVQPPIVTSSEGKPLRCHWLAVARIGDQIVAEICFFSRTCYRVVLRDTPFAIQVNERYESCHVYDLDEREVFKYNLPPRMRVHR